MPSTFGVYFLTDQLYLQQMSTCEGFLSKCSIFFLDPNAYFCVEHVILFDFPKKLHFILFDFPKKIYAIIYLCGYVFKYKNINIHKEFLKKS